MFWVTVGFSLASGAIGYWLSRNLEMSIGSGPPVPFAPSGVIVVTTVALFFGSMVVVAVWNRFAPIFGGKQFRL